MICCARLSRGRHAVERRPADELAMVRQVHRPQPPQVPQPLLVPPLGIFLATLRGRRELVRIVIRDVIQLPDPLLLGHGGRTLARRARGHAVQHPSTARVPG